MSRHPITDGWKIALAGLVGLVGPVVVVGLVIVGLFISCRKMNQMDLEIGYAADTVRITDSVIVVRTDTVIARQRVVTRLDSIVQIVSDTQYVVESDTVLVPAVVIERDRAKDSLIVSLYRRDSTQEWRIASRDKLIAVLSKEPRLERWIGAGYDPIEKAGSVTAGATLKLYKGIALDAYVDQPLIVGEKPYVRVLIGYWRSF